MVTHVNYVYHGSYWDMKYSRVLKCDHHFLKNERIKGTRLNLVLSCGCQFVP